MTPEGPIGYGLIGCGSFGRFCLSQYEQLDEVRPVAVVDRDREAARETATQHGVEAAESIEALLARDDIDIVHIATPPASHKTLTLAALGAGKHVLCEKPLATTLEDGRSLVGAAKKAGRNLAVNLVMPYNPLSQAMKAIVGRRLLGEPLHGYFENYAKDEPLPPGHWFWNRQYSGGIFVEHGVHFFDLFAWWLGDGAVVAAQSMTRPGTDIEEAVNCTALYGSGVPVNFYHGFTQATRMDRQRFLVLFERGEVSMSEWVPTDMTIDALVDEPTRTALEALLPGADIRTTETYTGAEREVTSRHKSYEVDHRIAVSWNTGKNKDQLYSYVLKELLRDQAAAIRNPDHPRRVTEVNAIRSLEMAMAARDLAGTATVSDR